MAGEPREVTDGGRIAWTCLQAYAGISEAAPTEDAARITGSDRVAVVCTPSGGARSKRLALPATWHQMSDEELLSAIAAG